MFKLIVSQSCLLSILTLVVVSSLNSDPSDSSPFKSSPSSSSSSSSTSASPSSPSTSSNGSLLFTCPEQFGYYVDNSDCTKYFVCVFGEALHEVCTGGLYFSSELQTCDWPRNVHCGRGNKTEKVTHLSGLSKGSSNSSDDYNENKEVTYETSLDGNVGNDALLQPPITLPDIDISSGNDNHANNGGISSANSGGRSSATAGSSTSSDGSSRKDKESEDLDLQRSRTTLNKNFVTNSGNTNFNYLDFNGNSNANGRSNSGRSLSTLPAGSQSTRNDNSTFSNNNIHLDVEPPLVSNYDETSSTVVDSDGGIHLPDGRGGLFGINGQLPGLLSGNQGDKRDETTGGGSGKEVRSIDESRLPGEHRTGRSSDDLTDEGRFLDRRRGIPHYQLQALRQAQHFRRMSPVIPIILPKPGSNDASNPSGSSSSSPSTSSSSPTTNIETKRQDYDYDNYPSEPATPLIHGPPESGLSRSNIGDNGRTRGATRSSSSSSPKRGVHYEPSFVEYIDGSSDRPGEGYYEEEKIVIDHYNQARNRQPQHSSAPTSIANIPRSTPTLPLPPPNRGESQPPSRPKYPAVPRINSQPHFRPFIPPYAGFEERAHPQPPPSSTGSHRHQRPSSDINEDRDKADEELNDRQAPPSTWDAYPRIPDPTPHHDDHDVYSRPVDDPPTRYISHEPVTESPRTTEPENKRLAYPPSGGPSINPASNRKPGSGLQQPATSPYHQPGLSVSRNRPRTQSFNSGSAAGEHLPKPKPQQPPPPPPTQPPSTTTTSNRVRPSNQDTAPRLPTGSGVPSEHGQPFGLVDYDDELSSDQRFPVSGPIIEQPQPQPPPPRTRTPTTTPPTTTAIALVVHKPPSNRQRVNFTPINAPPQSQPSNPYVGNVNDRSARPTSSSSGSTGSSSSSYNSANNDQGSNRRRPRPTNKRLTVRPKVTGPPTLPSRPANLYPTVEPGTPATKCDPRVCRLPDCNCGSASIPGGLKPSQVPQMVMITFDDAINDLNWEIYEEIFNSKRRNPNGCPLLGTFYVSHEWTDYGQVQTLYSRGHEMASHGVTHSFGEKFSTSQWHKEIHGQREILYLYGGVKMEDVRGMRAPFLQIGGNKMFQMLYNDNFTYDSSMPVFDNKPPFWPYTLDYSVNHECMIAPCPTESFPGVWEVGMVMWEDLRGGRCSMGDACSNPSDEDGVYNMLLRNFKRHYNSNRAPFGLYYHSAWFNTAHHRKGFMRFMDEILSYGDVYFTTKWQMLQWVRNPTPISTVNSFEPWDCKKMVENRPGACNHPTVCNVRGQHGHRFMKTCQSCPSFYPWLGKTGL
uniref:Chitin deacetylase protein 5a n=1 Tax=Tetranychus cinnabarinus TaxID=93129 RepID=A0A5P9Q4N5_TETCI|nr:chitin deacetylase protein 5a [Tetranychus cinnabarinus]